MSKDALRSLPAVNAIADDAALADLRQTMGRDPVVRAARGVLEAARAALLAGDGAPGDLVAAVRARLETRPKLYRRVINATGVVLHTNLGRAPIPDPAREAMLEALGYCDLEMDLEAGARASRQRGVEEPLVALTGAEAGMVVNNCAATVLLGLSALAGEKPTVISRGHLIEIGGGFRLPTIMEASGSPLVEVGTTNRTHLQDYEEALAAGAGLLLLVHRSNFVMEGYVTEPRPEEIVALGRKYGVPVMFDLGSGTLLSPADHGAPAELTVPEAVKMGFDAVCFSGDKLLGGPQAGFVVGRGDVIERLKRHPIARAVRCDKVQLAGAVATLELYRRGEALEQVPVWRALGQDARALRARAVGWQERLGRGDVVETQDAVGGGSLPEAPFSGFALALAVEDPDGFLKRLRLEGVVGHIVKDRVLLHPRTVEARDDDFVIAAVERCVT